MAAAHASFRFAVINDLHYTEPADRPWLEALMQQLNATPGLELVLVLGDLAELGTYVELSAARDILGQLRCPWYTVPGNHDGPEYRAVGSGAAGLADYEKLFP